MKKLLIIPFLLISLISSATVYYIDPSGKSANNGSAASPWNSLSYACSKVKTAGDIIHVNAGTYNETASCVLAAGVSIEGAGATSIIQSQIGGTTYTISLSSSSEATNGNQHISNIKMDGMSYAAYGAILVSHRKNVEIYNCTFVNFNYYGVSFLNGEPPSVYATGNKFYNNTVTNCGGYFSGNRGALEIQGQDGMQIYGNILSIDRPDGKNGDCIYGVEGFLKNVKIYNNTFNKKYVPGKTNWDFAIEFWNCLGGIEIYNNDFTGSIDLAISTKGSSSYSVWIHNNKIGQKELLASESIRGIILEKDARDMIIERNEVKNVAAGIMVNTQYANVTMQNVRISSNIFSNIGVGDSYSDNKGWGIEWGAGDGDHVQTTSISNIEIINNVFAASQGARSTMWGIEIPDSGIGNGIKVINNIVSYFDYAPVYARQGSMGGVSVDNLSIQNNIFYGNGNNDAPKYSSITPSNVTTKNNITGNPMFMSSSNFHLQAGSPAIGKGLSIATVTSDFDGNKFNNPPSIGAFESSLAAAAPQVPVYQNGTVENAAPALVVMTYNASLANVIPSATAFTVQVNSSPRTVNQVAISGSKVQLTLASAVAKGDVVKISYTKPASNPLQNAAGGQAATLSAQLITNNVAAKEPVTTTTGIKLTINPNAVHSVMNTLIAYSAPLSTENASSLILRIFDISGRLFVEKLLSNAPTSIKLPVNLSPGIYVVQILMNGLEMASQKIIVY